jgi:asparagine synthase (glutamine-hydrolysing)
MCGFLGAWAFNRAIEEYAGRLSRGLSAIRHRGPDSSNEVADHDVYLGHNRLSIIDLTAAANQPLRAASAEAWIVYNGEIYNYEELRRNLKGI